MDRAAELSKNALELLIEFKQTGRHEPFEQIVHRYGGMVYSTCFGITKNRHDAEDATQAVFLTLAAQGNSAKEIKYLGPWLQQVARRLSLDIRRSKKRRSRREEVHHELHRAREWVDGMDGLDLEDLKGVVSEELGKLPLKYRLPLILHYFGGMSRDEMARELGCKANTLGVRIHRGKQMLGVRLTRRGVTVASALLPWALTEAVQSAVTQSLVGSTAHAAVQFSVFGGASTALVPGNVLALAHGAPQAMLVAKFKFLAIALAVAGTIMAASAAAVAKLEPIQNMIPADLDVGNAVRPLMKLLTPIRMSDARESRPQHPRQPDTLRDLPPAPPGRERLAATPLTPMPPAARPAGPRRSPEVQLHDAVAAKTSPAPAPLPAAAADRPDAQAFAAMMPALPSERADLPLPSRSSPIHLPSRSNDSAARPAAPPPTPQSPDAEPHADVPPMEPTAAKVDFDYQVLAVNAGQNPSQTRRRDQMPSGVPVALAENAEQPTYRVLSSSIGADTIDTVSSYPWSADLDSATSSVPGVTSLRGEAFTSYFLSEDEISSEVELIGQVGAGVFHHVGGLNSTESLLLGQRRGGSGTYALTGGTLRLAPGGDDRDQLVGVEIGRTGTGLLRMGNVDSSGTVAEVPGTRASLVVRSDRRGSGAVHGWGKIALSGTLDNSGRVIADGFGRSRVLDLSGFAAVKNKLDNGANGGNGWFARDGGGLLLPPIPVTAGSGTYTWGEDPDDHRIDLINSLRFAARDVPADGEASISLLSLDNADVPTLPAGHAFIGVWSFDFGGNEPASMDLSIRYDARLADELGLDESHLKLWAYDDSTGWQHVLGNVDVEHHLISGTVNGGRLFGVSAPEPGAVGIMVLGAAGLLLRRRRP